jgi:hypothetical protein
VEVPPEEIPQRKSKAEERRKGSLYYLLLSIKELRS